MTNFHGAVRRMCFMTSSATLAFFKRQALIVDEEGHEKFVDHSLRDSARRRSKGRCSVKRVIPISRAIKGTPHSSSKTLVRVQMTEVIQQVFKLNSRWVSSPVEQVWWNLHSTPYGSGTTCSWDKVKSMISGVCTSFSVLEIPVVLELSFSFRTQVVGGVLVYMCDPLLASHSF